MKNEDFSMKQSLVETCSSHTIVSYALSILLKVKSLKLQLSLANISLIKS